MKQARPKALKRIGDVGEPEAIEHYGAQPHYTKTGDHDGVECWSDAPHAKFIQRATAIEAVAQAGVTLHKTLQKGGDRHQAQAASDDQGRQHHLAHQGEFLTDIDDRKTRHRDRRDHGEQGFPKADAIAGAERTGQYQRASGDHQATAHHRELRHRESGAPALELDPGRRQEGPLKTR